MNRLAPTLCLILLAPIVGGRAAVPPSGGMAAAGAPDPPVVTSILPNDVPCVSPDFNRDVQIDGIGFDQITSGFLTTTPDASGTRIPIDNIVNRTLYTVTGTIRVASLTPGTPHYVYLVRSDGVISTSYPTVFGYSVTFKCTPPVDGGGPPRGAILTTCRVRSVGARTLVLVVNGARFKVNDTIVLVNGQMSCAKTRYPSKFQAGDRTTRLTCHGLLKKLLPATITTRDSDGRLSDNSLRCEAP